MKIADLLGTNSKTMTIEMYCGRYGVTLTADTREQIEKYNAERRNFFVFIGSTGVDLLVMRERSELLGKIVGGRLHRGAVLWFDGGIMTWVNRQNWKEIWKEIAPRKAYVRDDRVSQGEILAHREKKRLEAFVSEGMPEQAQGKLGKKGHSTVERHLMIPTKRKYSWFDTGAQAKQKSSEIKHIHSRIYRIEADVI